MPNEIAALVLSLHLFFSLLLSLYLSTIYISLLYLLSLCFPLSLFAPLLTYAARLVCLAACLCNWQAQLEAGKELRAEAEPVAQVDAGADELTSDRTCPTATTQKRERQKCWKQTTENDTQLKMREQCWNYDAYAAWSMVCGGHVTHE